MEKTNMQMSPESQPVSSSEEVCPWCGSDPIYQQYHNEVWGRPVMASQELFEKLCLDGQQAGLSWITILKRQAHYHEAYARFNPQALSKFGDEEVALLMQNPGIIRNRLKVESIIRNAKAWLRMQSEGESLSEFLWSFVDYQPIQNQWQSMKDVPTTTTEAQAMSKALKKKGFNFVGPTICYAFMQAVGMVNDHLQSCPQWHDCHALRHQVSKNALT
jgi:DNA-3-methyladenine glycosylase I